MRYPVIDITITQSWGENPSYYADLSQHPAWSYPGHNGIDFAGAGGTFIYPVEIGIAWVGYEAGGYGNYVRVTHKSGDITYYCHLKTVKSFTGNTVNPNVSIGIMGDSGCAFGVHLHLGWKPKKGGAPGYKGYDDPMKFLDEKPNPQPSVEDEEIDTGFFPKSGLVQTLTGLRIRTAPSITAPIAGSYTSGAAPSYDGKVEKDGITWLIVSGLYIAANFNGKPLVKLINP